MDPWERGRRSPGPSRGFSSAVRGDIVEASLEAAILACFACVLQPLWPGCLPAAWSCFPCCARKRARAPLHGRCARARRHPSARQQPRKPSCLCACHRSAQPRQRRDHAAPAASAALPSAKPRPRLSRRTHAHDHPAQERFAYAKATVGLSDTPARRPLAAAYARRFEEENARGLERQAARPGGQRWSAGEAWRGQLDAARRAEEAAEEAEQVGGARATWQAGPAGRRRAPRGRAGGRGWARGGGRARRRAGATRGAFPANFLRPRPAGSQARAVHYYRGGP